MQDELKIQRAHLLARRILRQDHGIAALERQLIREADHRAAVAEVIAVIDSCLDQLPKRLGQQVALSDLVLHELSRAAIEMRISFAQQVADLTHTPTNPTMPIALQRLTLGRRSRAARVGR